MIWTKKRVYTFSAMLKIIVTLGQPTELDYILASESVDIDIAYRSTAS